MITVMDNEVQALFETVCQLSPSDRTVWIQQNVTDARLRREVEELLRYDGLAEDESFLKPRPAQGERDGLIGTQVGPYQVISLIGRGGMGSVYLARRSVPYEQDVALKVADLRLGTGAARFDEERQVLADLHHPGIARLLDGGVLKDDRPYLVMEYVPGEHIDAYADTHKLRVMEQVQLWLKVCEAMASAHERGIIHRDLKPSNILVTKERRAVVVDFGLARRWEQDSGLTRTATVLGTPEYMAPEQATGKRLQTTPATDVYALGAVLYTLLTGRPPFRAESPMQMVTIMLRDDPVPARRLNPAVPRDLETICMKCLEKEPGKRYASATELADDVIRLLRGEPIRARAMGMVGRSWRWTKRRPALAAMIGLLLVTILGSLLIVFRYWTKSTKALELAKQAASNQFKLAIDLKDRQGMQRTEMEFLTNVIASQEALVKALDDEQIYLLYFRARHELSAASVRMNESAKALQNARQHRQDLEEYAKSHHSDELLIELAQSFSQESHCLTATPETLPLKMDLIKRAIDVLTKLREHAPNNQTAQGMLSNYYLTLGHVETLMGRHTNVESHYEMALKLIEPLYDKTDPQSRMRYCDCLARYWSCLHQQGKAADKLHLLERAAKEDQSLSEDFPTHPEYRMQTHGATTALASVMEWRGDWKRAYQLIKNTTELCEKLKVINTENRHHQARPGNCYLNLGELAWAMGDTDTARQHYSQCLEVFEEVYKKFRVDAIQTLTHAYVLAECPVPEFRNAKRALELNEECLQLLAGNQDVLLNRGICLLRNEKLSEAQKVLEQVLTIIPDDQQVQAHAYLAITLAKMGNRLEAQKELAAIDQHMVTHPKEVLMLRLRDEVMKDLSKK